MTRRFRRRSWVAIAAASLASVAMAPRRSVVPASGWVSHGPEGAGVFGLAADLRSPGVLYTLTGGGVFLSEDGGASWASRTDGLDDLPFSLVVSAGDPPALYGSSDRKSYRSLDGGVTWETSDVVHRPVAVDPSSSRRVFAQGGVPLTSCTLDVSDDGAQTWRTVYECSGIAYLSSMAFDPENPRIVYAGVDVVFQDAVLKSTDGGESWSPSGQGIAEGVRALVIDSNDPRVLYALAGALDVYRTVDGGATWKKVSAQPASYEILSLALDAVDGNLFAGTPDGLFRSHGGDAAWVRISPLQLNTLTIFADASAPFFAGGLDGPVRSDDRGVTWTDAAGGLYGATIWALTAAPDGALVAATTLKVFSSENGGRSWSKQSYAFPNGGGISDLVATSNPPVLYAATSGDGVQSSVDGGKTWAEIGTGLASTKIDRLARTPSGILIAAGDTGLYEWRPGGDWVRDAFFGDTQVSLLEASPSSDGVVYAGASASLFRSADSGATWQVTRLDLFNVTALALDPNDSRVLYAVLNLNLYDFPTFQKSTDSGQTWTPLGLGGISVGCLAVDPSDSRVVYACADSTLFRSSDGGETWSRFDQGIAFSPSISRVEVGPDGRPHLATFGQSVLDRNSVREVHEVSRAGATP